MQKVFNEVGSLDKRCYEQYSLSEDILMENASNSMKDYIEKNFQKGSKVLIVCGNGNNGADGITLARQLQSYCQITLFLPFGASSDMAKLQLQRAQTVGIEAIISYEVLTLKYDLVVDALFGSGLNKELDSSSVKIIEQINRINAFKLSSDIPSGINNKGKLSPIAFCADLTITMGALKKSLFSDEAKDFTGEIKVANLGVQRDLYETSSNIFLLDFDDMILPFRQKQNTNKGTFGHLAVIVGQKAGAGLLCAKAGFRLGAGLVSVIGHSVLNPPSYVMQNHSLPQNTSSIAIGMGLGDYKENEIDEVLFTNIPKVIDADLFYSDVILKVLDQENIVLTPHPKEFCSLLKICGIENIDTQTLQKERFFYLKQFCKKYPNVVLVLKGANTLIGKAENIYINPHGSSKLSFGGSGDVLAGFIGALLAQKYDSLQAAISSSLVHAKIANNFKGNDFSMTPEDLITGAKDVSLS